MASSGEPAAAVGAARGEARRAAPPTLTREQAAFDRRLLVLNLTVCAGYWREVDGCIGLCADFATDTAKDGLLHLTMFYAARDAAKARAAHTGDPWYMAQKWWTRLHWAAMMGLAGRVAVLVAAGADVNARDTDGRTALFWASYRGHTAVVTALLACPGIDANAVNVIDWTPLHWASYNGHTAVVAALLAHPGILVNAATTLKIAKYRGHAEIVVLLLEAAGTVV